jgi:anti-sigma B factor antagonist
MQQSVEPGLRILREHDDERIVIQLDGELDMATAAPVREELQHALAGDCSGILLDLRRLGFLDSTGIHALVEAHERCTGSGRSFQILLAPGHVHRVLQVSGMLTVLDHMTEEGLAA